MKTPVMSSLLVCSLLLASFSSLVGCSSVLQANRLSRSTPRQPAEIVANVSPKSVSEQASSMTDVRQADAEEPQGLPRSMASGYRWVFIVKEGARNTPGFGNWVVIPNR